MLTVHLSPMTRRRCNHADLKREELNAVMMATMYHSAAPHAGRAPLICCGLQPCRPQRINPGSRYRTLMCPLTIFQGQY